MQHKQKMIVAMVCVFLCLCSFTTAFAGSPLEEAMNKANSILKRSEEQIIETPLLEIFIDFGNQIGTISFRQVDHFVKSAGFKYERTVPTNSAFGKHILYDENGFEFTMSYMPLDSSFDSKDFGNLDKEMLDLISLSRHECSITMSDKMHTVDVGYWTYDKSRSVPNQQVYSIDSLLSFFQNSMDGIVADELKNAKTAVSESQKIESTIEKRAKEYTRCTLESVEVNRASGQSSIKYVVMVYFEYGINSLDVTKERINTYSDDLAAYLAQKHDAVAEVYIFWTVPRYYEDEIAAKCSYSVANGHAYIDSRYGLIYRNSK